MSGPSSSSHTSERGNESIITQQAAVEEEETSSSRSHHRKPLETDRENCIHNGNDNDDDVSYASSSRSEGFFHDNGDYYQRADDNEILLLNHRTTTMSDNNDKPSNERLLGTAFVSFMSFALVQLAFAFIAESEAMKGDSAAMIVDALTYLFNWIAEHKKNHFDWDTTTNNDPALLSSDNDDNDNNNNDPTRLRRLKKREYRKMVLQMEIAPPLLSVSTLLIVTVVVTYQAVLVLTGRKPSAASMHPDLHLMMGFSIFNLGLDGLNVFCFARAKHLLGYETMTKEQRQASERAADGSSGYALATDTSPTTSIVETTPAAGSSSSTTTTTTSTEQHDAENGCLNIVSSSTPPQPPPQQQQQQPTDGSRPLTDDSERSELEAEEEDRTNLNMCSAYTHVFADTLRSIAVIVAASVAELIPDVTPLEADATAAIAVSILIALSLLPLFQGLTQSIAELRGIYGEERSERMLQQSRRRRMSLEGIMS